MPLRGHFYTASDNKTYGYDYEETVLGKDASLTSLKAITGRYTVPQIFIGGEFIGDSEALRVYL